MSYDWDMEKHLELELNNLSKCMADHVLFLDASIETLYEHKTNDNTRKRGSFDHYIANMLPLKRD